MDAEVLAPARQVPWRALGVATVAAAAGALVLNLALGRVLAAGVPDGVGTPSAELVAGGDPASGASGVDDAGDGVAVADGVGGGGFGGSDPVGDARGRVAASTHVSETEYRGAILGRNLFDATKIGTKDADCADTPEGCPPEEESTLELAAMLTGTLVSDVPAYSAAFIVEDGKTSAMAYGIGQKLKDAELVEIRDDRVRFRRGADEQWLILGQKSGEGKPASTVASADPGAAGEGGITKSSETSFAIDRSLWEAKLQDLTSLSREARPLLHRGPDGNYDGYRLSAIRRGSLADQLGIKNGDIIHSVNGTPIDSVDAAMRAFDELRSGSSFKLEVTRRGQPVSLDYAVK